MDVYDPSSDDYLKALYVFKELYDLRDEVAQDIDVHKKMVSSD